MRRTTETRSRYHDADCLRVLANWADSAAMMRPLDYPKRRKEHRQPECLTCPGGRIEFSVDAGVGGE